MGRPKKSKSDSVSTKEKILLKARELFAEKGFDAVSVRDITRSLGLNEASLYNHYKNKAHLFEVILERLDETLIKPSFLQDLSSFEIDIDSFDLGAFLIEGAKFFFNKTDNDVVLTWRMLMISQYKFEKAKNCIVDNLLNAPALFFEGIFKRLQVAGVINSATDCKVAGRLLSSIFFGYSFRSNLNLAWDQEESDFVELEREINLVSRGFI